MVLQKTNELGGKYLDQRLHPDEVTTSFIPKQGLKGRVLFVDDDANLLSTLNRMLRPKHMLWEMVFETDPLKAVGLAKKQRFDVVVSDLRMPKLSGLELIKRIRGCHKLASQYILLTGNADLGTAIDAINTTGVFKLFTKPCEISRLIEAIDVALSNVAKQQGGLEEVAKAALSAMAPAVVIVDSDCRVLYCNESANDLLKAHNGIVIDPNSTLRGNCADGRHRLREAVKTATQDEGCEPSYVVLGGSADLDPLSVLVVGLCKDRAAITLTIPDLIAVPSEESLIRYFNLTRVEATIVRTIASNGTVEDAAHQSDVTLETARTYLKRIFQKTGVRRQVDLVNLIMKTPAAFMRVRSP